MAGRLLAGLLSMMACIVPAAAATYELPADGSPVVGADTTLTTVYADTLPEIAHRFSLGYYEIIRANPDVDVWLPGTGKTVLIPGRRILPTGPREGIVVNLPEHRLYYYPKPRGRYEKRVVITFPVSIGKMDWRTPLGETRVIAKIRHPVWYPPESIRKEHAANGDPLPKEIGPGPENPLGDFALRLAAGEGEYLIHGTNNPIAVGMSVTHGCIRMYPEDIAALFPLVPVGTRVWLINDPVKVAWVDGQLLIEVHPPVDEQGQTIEPNLELLSKLLDQALGASTAAIHWDLARRTLQAANGIPTVVGLAATPDSPDENAHTPQETAAAGPATGGR
ncbi:MAG TPA: L,D-transpeptidase family protein [Steroidobacteraceae bacterium]|nr:L,D-transpeptidase family protein [Steroidobacteraceae bacterium]